MPKLLIALEDAKVVHELTEEKITIGRAPDSTLQIPDSSVSSRHATLTLVGGRYQLADLNSTNGTRVNGEIVTEVFLQVGDRVRFGKVEARYESEKNGDVQALPQADEIVARPAETSEKPSDFTNASPFPNRKKEMDSSALAVYAVAAIAILAMLLSLLNLLRLQAPV